MRIGVDHGSSDPAGLPLAPRAGRTLPHNTDMKKPSDRQARALVRPLITASAGALLILGQASCDGLGIGKKGATDESALADLDGPKKKKRSMFASQKNKNAWIDEDIQTTRRDRYAASNSTTFAPVEDSPVPQTPAPAPAPSSHEDFALDLEPNADFNTSPRDGMTASSPRSEERLQLPTLDSDFPQPGQPSPPIDTNPAPGSRHTSAPPLEDEGYIPLQPKLPGAEQIQPPRD